jgi:hypothetical protein
MFFFKSRKGGIDELKTREASRRQNKMGISNPILK